MFQITKLRLQTTIGRLAIVIGGASIFSAPFLSPRVAVLAFVGGAAEGWLGDSPSFAVVLPVVAPVLLAFVGPGGGGCADSFKLASFNWAGAGA